MPLKILIFNKYERKIAKSQFLKPNKFEFFVQIFFLLLLRLYTVLGSKFVVPDFLHSAEALMIVAYAVEKIMLKIYIKPHKIIHYIV